MYLFHCLLVSVNGLRLDNASFHVDVFSTGQGEGMVHNAPSGPLLYLQPPPLINQMGGARGGVWTCKIFGIFVLLLRPIIYMNFTIVCII